ncbi:MAG: FHA domain-containing protein [Anaerolineae bacterium]|nr:FHA domain-containing protein [Anaerolineae bacterium]
MSEILVLALRALLAISLYAFLGVALYTIWQSLRASGFQILSHKPPTIALSIEDSLAITQEFSISEVTIGRDPNCEFTIQDETVSAHHARLRFHHNHWWLEDLNSTNGSFLNNERVEVPTIIMTGDEIQIGKAIITVHITES